jgi:endonuclease-3 related protein
MNLRRKELLHRVYDQLYSVFGPQHWWPAETPFEVIVGAILTQNTSWKNVRKSIENLRSHNLLSFEALIKVTGNELAPLLRSSGYYNQKTRKLKAFCDHVQNHWKGDLSLFLSQEMHSLRLELLSIHGIGPETADSIVLYAAYKPSFAVDRYTHRIFSRHGWISEDATPYGELRDFFMDCLEPDVHFFQEYHALLVRAGHLYCRRKPLCASCPLLNME